MLRTLKGWFHRHKKVPIKSWKSCGIDERGIHAFGIGRMDLFEEFNILVNDEKHRMIAVHIEQPGNRWEAVDAKQFWKETRISKKEQKKLKKRTRMYEDG